VVVIKVAKPIPKMVVLAFLTTMDSVRLYYPGWRTTWSPESSLALMSAAVLFSVATNTFSNGTTSSN